MQSVFSGAEYLSWKKDKSIFKRGTSIDGLGLRLDGVDLFDEINERQIKPNSIVEIMTGFVVSHDGDEISVVESLGQFVRKTAK